MRVAAKKRHTEEIEIAIGRKHPRLYAVPQAKAHGIMQILKEYEIKNRHEGWVAAEEVFPDLRSVRRRAGSALKGLRLRDGLTQVEVAKRLGCPQSWISQMESGTRPIGKKMAARLAKVLKTNPRVFQSH